jgi:3-phenylpropionate/trans-cinnamate dioxygenase ferredoxin component
MPTERITLLPLAELRPSQMKCVVVDGLPIGVANVDGHVYAFDDACRHEGGPLSSGALINDTVTCPWHGWTYQLQSGKAIVPPVGIRIRVYPVTIDDGMICVEVDWGDIS